jgi:hypothetical protein
VAEYSYLGVGKRTGKARMLLASKRSIPLGWMLAFERGSKLDDRGRLISDRAASAQRIRTRAENVARVTGPRLRAVMLGFARFLEERREPDLVLDVSETLALGFTPDDIDELLAIATRFDRPGDPELDDPDEDWGLEKERGRYEIEEGVDGSYPLFGGSLDVDLPWLRPPEKDDGARNAAVERAFVGYTRVSDPTPTEDGMRWIFRHPAHRGVVFVVNGEWDLWATTPKRAEIDVDWEAVVFGPSITTERKLAAWASHVAEHFGRLGFPAEHGRTSWTSQRGANDFAQAMIALDDDLELLERGLEAHLVDQMRTFVVGTAPWASFDLGPIGSLLLARTNDPLWEPHVRAIVRKERGDATWRSARPDFFASPIDQEATAQRALQTLHARAENGARLSGARGEIPLTLFLDRVEPERFVVDWVPARALEHSEIAGEYAFIGASLVVVTAKGTRTAFKFPVPPDFDRREPPMVSGFWTAKNGDRFATVLRNGRRVWQFEPGGRLLAGPIVV